MNNQKENLITLEEACKMTPYSADYLGQLIRKGRLEAWKEKGRWLTTKIAVEEYVLKVAEESYQHHETLVEKIPELEKKPITKWKWAYLGLGMIFVATGIFGSYVFFGSKNVGVCKSFEVVEDKNGNEVIRVGNKEYMSNVLAAAKTSLAKLEY